MSYPVSFSNGNFLVTKAKAIQLLTPERIGKTRGLNPAVIKLQGGNYDGNP
jgi:hypothetical protein